MADIRIVRYILQRPFLGTLHPPRSITFTTERPYVEKAYHFICEPVELFSGIHIGVRPVPYRPRGFLWKSTVKNRTRYE